MTDKAVDTSDLQKTLQRLAGEPKVPEPPTQWLFDTKEEREAYDRSMVRRLSFQNFIASFLTEQIITREVPAQL